MERNRRGVGGYWWAKEVKETVRQSLTDKRNHRKRQKQSKRESERKGESRGKKKRCSPRVAWSRSCPINTGEQLDSLRPPGWLTAESSHWPPALCYMTRGVQLNWQREAAWTSQSAGGRGWTAPYAHCLKQPSRTAAALMQNTQPARSDRRRVKPFSFTGEQKKETP